MIKKRKIFYISGFDPRGFRFHRQALSKAVQDHAALSSVDITLEKDINNREKLLINNHHEKTQNEYIHLKWDDIVRENWEKNLIILMFKILKSYYRYFLHVQWRKMIHCTRAPIISFYLPFFIFVAIFLSIFFVTSMVPISKFYTYPAGMVLGVSAGIYSLDYLKLLWLLRLFIFNAEYFGGDNKRIMQRISVFKATMLQEDFSDCDEIILSAHSNGTVLLIPLMKLIIQENPELLPKIKILALGHCIPLVAYYAKSDWYQKDMQFIMQYPFLWLDLSTPVDSICFAKQDPFLPFTHEKKVNIYSKSPQFHKYYPQKSYEELKKDKFKIHFCYFDTPPIQSPFCYMHLISSAKPLQSHFQG